MVEIHLGCVGCSVKLRGRLAPGLHDLQQLRVLHLPNNELSGPLPPEWGAPGGFPQLLELVRPGAAAAGTCGPLQACGAA